MSDELKVPTTTTPIPPDIKPHSFGEVPAGDAKSPEPWRPAHVPSAEPPEDAPKPLTGPQPLAPTPTGE